MIVIPRAQSLRLVTQPDHARLAAQVLALWRADGFPGHPRRLDLLTAVREHDNGWREADAAPLLDAGGRPVDFRAAPDTLRREVWLRGVERYAGEQPYIALLTARHALHLHRDRRELEDWRPAFERLDGLWEELLERTSLGAEGAETDYRWLLLADTLSLALCEAIDGFDHLSWRGTPSPSGLRLEPFPLAGSTTFRLPCRTIPDRRYGGEADLAAALGSARWTELPVRLVP
jgi:hypothetical protein